MTTQNQKENAQLHQDFALQLRRTRLLSGVTQKELANKTGVTYQQIQKYENGTSRISAVRLNQMLDSLNTPYEKFFQNIAVTTPAYDTGHKSTRIDDATLKICARVAAVKDQALRQKIKDAIYCLTS